MKVLIKKIAAILLSVICAAAAAAPAAFAADDGQGMQKVRIGISVYDKYSYQDNNGVWCGVDIEYIENIAQHAGFDVEFVPIASTEESFRELDSGIIDMLADIARSDEREEKYLFSEFEQGSSSLSILVRKDDDRWNYGDIEQFANMKIGAESGNITSRQLRSWFSEHGISPDIEEFSSYDAVLEALGNGTVDAAMSGSESLDGYKTILSAMPTPYYFAFTKENIRLKNQVDTAMGQILSRDPLYEMTLRDKYGLSDSGENTALSSAEKAYIDSCDTLKVAVLRNDEPYYSSDAAGSCKGVLPDLYSKISDFTGLRFSFSEYDTHNEAMNAVINGDADILGMYSDGLNYAFNDDIHLTLSYSAVNPVIITRAGTNSQDIALVAVKERSRHLIENEMKGVLNADMKGYDTAASCMKALRDGSVDAAIVGLPSATWLINQTDSNAYRIMPVSSSSLDLCSAVTGSNSLLCSILDKGIYDARYSMDGIITNNTLQENNVRTAISRIPATMLAAIAAVMLALAVILVILIIMLIRRQRERVAVMAQATATEQERARIDALARNAAEKNAFFSNISHDMRTPLNAIIGFAGLAGKEANPPKTSDYLSKIQSSGALLNSLIDDTLTVSKASSGKLELHRVPLNTKKLFESVLVPVSQNAESRGVSLIVDDSGAADRTILADSLNLEKIILNLLSNSVKYTPAGGHIWFTVRNEPSASGSPDPDTVMTVRDDGIGISEDFIPHIFEPFAQERRKGYEESGTGLGLPIVKNLVELMGGTIDVKSTLNVGTIFTVRLHFEPAGAEVKEKPQIVAAAEEELRGLNVLVCEDNDLNREIAGELLKERGMNVIFAENGAIGVSRFAESKPGSINAILMDIRMPVLNGYEAAKRIRALDREDSARVPIIALTADAFADDMEKCLEAGMNAHIAKPVDPPALYRVLAAEIMKCRGSQNSDI